MDCVEDPEVRVDLRLNLVRDFNVLVQVIEAFGTHYKIAESVETRALLQSDNALTAEASMPETQVVLEENDVVGLRKLFGSEGGLRHATHERVFIGQRARLLPINVLQRAGQVPRKAF